MTERKLLYESDTWFDCRACGQCCRTDWNIRVETSKADRLRQEGLSLGLRQSSGGTWFTRKSKSACHFLTPDNLCSIHAKLGKTAKPQTCHLFPYVLTPTPDGLHIGLSHYCPSVRAEHGRPLSEHDDSLRALLDEQPVETWTGRLRLSEKHPLGWSGYRHLELGLLQRLRDSTPDEVLLGLFSGLCRNPSGWQREPLESSFGKPRAELYTSFEPIVAQLAESSGLAISRQSDSRVGRSYLSSLVQRKFLLKTGSLLENLAVLGAASVLLRTARDTDACVEQLELLLTHTPGFSLQTQTLVRMEHSHWNPE